MSEDKISQRTLDDSATGKTSGSAPDPVDDPLTGHEYDGIQEYDNPLPGWWKWLFVATVVFSIPYWAYYHFGTPGRSVSDAFTVASAEVDRKLVAAMGELRPDRETLVRFLTNDTGLSVGMSVYRAQCAQCHGKDGEGIVGPNLTDEYFKNVRSIEDILTVVNNGAAGGAMPPWLNRLGETERILVSAYVAHLRGSKPAGTGKAPEGRVIDAWPTLAEVEAGAAEEAKPEAVETAAASGAAGEQTADEVAAN